MKITFRERRKKKSNYNDLQQIAEKVLYKYVDPEILKSVKIEIFLGPFYNGECGQFFCNGGLPYRRFRIDVNNQKPVWRIRQTVRHEAIHIKQILNEEHINWIDDNEYWKGIMIDPNLDYYNDPAEIEAYTLENVR